MEIKSLVEKAFQRNLSDPSALSDAFDSIRLLEPEDFTLAHERNKEVRRLSASTAAVRKIRSRTKKPPYVRVEQAEPAI